MRGKSKQRNAVIDSLRTLRCAALRCSATRLRVCLCCALLLCGDLCHAMPGDRTPQVPRTTRRSSHESPGAPRAQELGQAVPQPPGPLRGARRDPSGRALLVGKEGRRYPRLRRSCGEEVVRLARRSPSPRAPPPRGYSAHPIHPARGHEGAASSRAPAGNPSHVYTPEQTGQTKTEGVGREE